MDSQHSPQLWELLLVITIWQHSSVYKFKSIRELMQETVEAIQKTSLKLCPSRTIFGNKSCSCRGSPKKENQQDIYRFRYINIYIVSIYVSIYLYVCIYLSTKGEIFKTLVHTIMWLHKLESLKGKLAGWRLREELTLQLETAQLLLKKAQMQPNGGRISFSINSVGTIGHP